MNREEFFNEVKKNLKPGATYKGFDVNKLSTDFLYDDLVKQVPDLKTPLENSIQKKSFLGKVGDFFQDAAVSTAEAGNKFLGIADTTADGSRSLIGGNVVNSGGFRDGKKLEGLDKTIDYAGALIEVGSNFIPVGRAAALGTKLGTTGIKSGLTQLGKKLSQVSFKDAVKREASFGALTGSLAGFGESLQEEISFDNTAIQTLGGAVIGAGAGGVVGGGSKVIASGFSKVFSKFFSGSNLAGEIANNVAKTTDSSVVTKELEKVDALFGLPKNTYNPTDLQDLVNISNPDIISKKIVKMVSDRIPAFEKTKNLINETNGTERLVNLLSSDVRTSDDILAGVVAVRGSSLPAEELANVVNKITQTKNKQEILDSLTSQITDLRDKSLSGWYKFFNPSADYALIQQGLKKGIAGEIINAKNAVRKASEQELNAVRQISEKLSKVPVNVLERFSKFANADELLSRFSLYKTTKNINKNQASRGEQEIDDVLGSNITDEGFLNGLKIAQQYGKEEILPGITFAQLRDELADLFEIQSEKYFSLSSVGGLEGDKTLLNIARETKLRKEMGLSKFLPQEVLNENGLFESSSFLGNRKNLIKEEKGRKTLIDPKVAYRNFVNALENSLRQRAENVQAFKLMDTIKKHIESGDLAHMAELVTSGDIAIVNNFKKEIGKFNKLKDSLLKQKRALEIDEKIKIDTQIDSRKTGLKNVKNEIKSISKDLDSLGKLIDKSLDLDKYKNIVDKASKNFKSFGEKVFKLHNKKITAKSKEQITEIKTAIKSLKDDFAQTIFKLKIGEIKNISSNTQKLVDNYNSKLDDFNKYAELEFDLSSNLETLKNLKSNLKSNTQKLKEISDIDSKISKIDSDIADATSAYKDARGRLAEDVNSGNKFVGYDEKGYYEIIPKNAKYRYMFFDEAGLAPMSQRLMPILNWFDKNFSSPMKRVLTTYNPIFKILNEPAYNLTYGAITADGGKAKIEAINSGLSQAITYPFIFILRAAKSFGFSPEKITRIEKEINQSTISLFKGAPDELLEKISEKIKNSSLDVQNDIRNTKRVTLAERVKLFNGQTIEKAGVNPNNIFGKADEVFGASNDIFAYKIATKRTLNYLDNGDDLDTSFNKALEDVYRTIPITAGMNSTVQALNKVMLYSGVSMISTKNFLGALKERPIETTGAMITLATIPVVAVHLMKEHYPGYKEYYEQLGEEQKKGLHIPYGPIVKNSDGFYGGVYVFQFDFLLRQPYLIAQKLWEEANKSDPSGYAALDIVTKYTPAIAADYMTLGLYSGNRLTDPAGQSNPIGTVIQNTAPGKVYSALSGLDFSKNKEKDSYRSKNLPGIYSTRTGSNRPTDGDIYVAKVFADFLGFDVEADKIRDLRTTYGFLGDFTDTALTRLLEDKMQDPKIFTGSEGKSFGIIQPIKPQKDFSEINRIVDEADRQEEQQKAEQENIARSYAALYEKYNVGTAEELAAAIESNQIPEDVELYNLAVDYDNSSSNFAKQVKKEREQKVYNPVRSSISRQDNRTPVYIETWRDLIESNDVDALEQKLEELSSSESAKYINELREEIRLLLPQ